jgi:hypothetical protein
LWNSRFKLSLKSRKAKVVVGKVGGLKVEEIDSATCS